MPSASSGACALAAALLAFSPSVLNAQTPGQVGERAQGMGGAFVAVADDASAIYWNPAGLATGSTFDLQLGLTSPRDSVDTPDPARPFFLGAALPVLGVGYYRVSSAVSTSADRKNGGSGEVGVSEVETQNFGASLVQTVVNKVVVGTTLRMVNGGGQTAFDLDVGTMASVGNVRVGATARNLRNSVDTQRQLRLGTAFVPRALPTGVLGPYSIAFDMDVTRIRTVYGDQRLAAAGSEQWWAKGAVGTRLGVHWDTIGEGNPAVAGGLTVKLPRSLFAEGHMTKGRSTRDSNWGVGARVTF
jgi:hypothetical protein